MTLTDITLGKISNELANGGAYVTKLVNMLLKHYHRGELTLALCEILIMSIKVDIRADNVYEVVDECIAVSEYQAVGRVYNLIRFGKQIIMMMISGKLAMRILTNLLFK